MYNVKYQYIKYFWRGKMQGFYGMRLVSRRYGEGTLKEWNGKTVTVKFAEKTVRCWFPKAFECGELTATNEQDGRRIREAIDGWVTSLMERLDCVLSDPGTTEAQINEIVEKLYVKLRGCYAKEKLAEQISDYRNKRLRQEEELRRQEEEARRQEAERRYQEAEHLRQQERRYLAQGNKKAALKLYAKRHANLVCWVSVVICGLLAFILFLAPLAPLSPATAATLGMKITGYDILKAIKESEKGFTIPVIFILIIGGLSLLTAVAGTAFRELRQRSFCNISAFALSLCAFAVGVGQAAWLGTLKLSAGTFSVLSIVFGILFILFAVCELLVRLLLIGKLDLRSCFPHTLNLQVKPARKHVRYDYDVDTLIFR